MSRIDEIKARLEAHTKALPTTMGWCAETFSFHENAHPDIAYLLERNQQAEELLREVSLYGWSGIQSWSERGQRIDTFLKAGEA